MNSADPLSRPRTWCRRFFLLVATAVLSYFAVVATMVAMETELVYHPRPAAVSWRGPASPTAQDVDIPTALGTRIHAWWCPAEGATGALLYCHGNNDNLSTWAEHVEMVRAAVGQSVLIFDYPGFGKSPGGPDEAGCCDAAEAAFDWLVKQTRIRPERILIYGVSLGGGPAVDLASRRPHRALLLASTYTSLPDVGAARYPWLPVRLLMRNRFDNLSKIGRCTGPVVITHGTADTLFPLAHGEALFAAAAEPKSFLPMPDVGHVDPDAGFFRRAREFIERVEKSSSGN
jgi:fermentation-respiration switch protein FrsA (DUF1100 family)